MKVSTVLGHQAQAGRTRLAQHVAQFLAAVGRVDGHQGQPRQRRTKLQDDPFGDARRPHRQPLAGLEAAEQRASRVLGPVQQLAVGPARRVAGSRVPAMSAGASGA